LVFGWAVITGAKDVATSYVVQSFPPLLFSLLMALFGFAGYGLANYGDSRRLWAMVQKDVRTVSLLWATSFVIWVAAVLALKFLEPAVSAVVAIGVTPLTTTVLSPWLRPHVRRQGRDWVCAIGIVCGVTYLAFSALGGSGGLGSQPMASTIAGFFCAIAAGVSIALSMYFGKDLYDKGWMPVQLLFVRVWAVCLLLSVYVLMTINPVSTAFWTRENLIIIVFLGVFGSILPTYLSQNGLRHLEPLTYAKLICLLPVFTLLFQYFDGRLQFTLETILGLCIILAFVIYGARQRSAKRPTAG